MLTKTEIAKVDFTAQLYLIKCTGVPNKMVVYRMVRKGCPGSFLVKYHFVQTVLKLCCALHQICS